MNNAQKIRLFLIWAFACIGANLFCTVCGAYEGDQGYWADWLRQLMDGGFGGFHGNYPPVYVWWLWVVSRIYSVTGLGIDKNYLLKFLCLWPVFFAHLGLLQIVWKWTVRRNMPAFQLNLILAFTALNPALLAGGPMWGQVDIVPLFITVAAFSLLFTPGKAKWAFPVFVLAILTKLQMIAFLPVFGALCLRRVRIAWKGIPIALGFAVLVLLPFIIAGNAKELLSEAYVTSTSMYPYSSYNAANLWMWTQGNVCLDTLPLFGLSADGIGKYITANTVGKSLFCLFSVFAFIKALRIRNPREAFKWATWNALAFFVLLPEMHERYILCVVPMSLLWLSRAEKKNYPWVVAITLFAAINVLFINGFHGTDMWPWLSALVCLTFFIAFVVWILPCKAKACALNLCEKLPVRKASAYLILAIVVIAIATVQVRVSRPVSADLASDGILVYNLQQVSQTQGYKSPQIGKTVDEHALTVGDRVYKDGIGTHAPSALVYQLPENADSLHVGYGIDDEANGGDVIFRIRVDGNIVWSSGPVQSGKGAGFIAVPVRGAKTVALETDTDGPDANDHADWLSPVVTRK